MLRLILPPLVGGLLGGGLGFLNHCSTGGCPLTSSWWTGALFGGLAGLAVALATAPAAGPKPPNEQRDHRPAGDRD